jgi:hypothetical protein
VWLNLLTMAFKTGADVYANNQRTKKLSRMQNYKLRYVWLVVKLNIKVLFLENQKSDWKDEFILILLSVPIVMLGFAVWSDNPAHMEKMKLFFEYFSDLPFWYQTIFVGVIASVYGLKATDLIKKK